MVSDLTGLEIANASLLDEGTAAAEAMHLTEAVSKHEGKLTYLVDVNCHPQTIAVVRTRAAVRGIDVVVADPDTFKFQGGTIGALIQYPATDGAIRNHRSLCEAAHAAGGGALAPGAPPRLAPPRLPHPRARRGPPPHWKGWGTASSTRTTSTRSRSKFLRTYSPESSMRPAPNKSTCAP